MTQSQGFEPENLGVDHESTAVTPIGLTVAAVARRLGIAPDTLRTWDRRYQLGASEHAAGSHRRYSAEDVARLDIMRTLVTQGVSPAEAARVARESDVTPASLVAPFVPPEAVSTLKAQTNDAPAGGGNVLSLEGEAQSTRGLSRAATMLDSGTCRQIVRKSFEAHGVLHTWENLLVPILISVGKKWEETGQGVEIEHMLAEVITGELRTVIDSEFEPVNSRPVILVCAPTELHTLPLFAIAAVLTEHKIATRVMGARTPCDALVNTCNKLGPSAVVVWSQTRGTADHSLWSQIPAQRPAVAKFAAGPGWVEDLPEQVSHISNLNHALVSVSEALRLDLSSIPR